MTLVICHILDFCTVKSLTGQIQVLFLVQRRYLRHVYRGTIFCLIWLWFDSFLL